VYLIIRFFRRLVVFIPAVALATPKAVLTLFTQRMRWLMQGGVVVLFGGRLNV
jgi:hypothetical protein